ncbi:MAG: helix-turn-helix domain-containing protein [Minwuia sp.]|uniref:helix-turn-helix domain-containing protein n=1 Tax=Minwuia sp. TaxID=2493630 RepID=UPI003A8ACC7E
MKTYIGPRLRRLRQQRNQTQAEMARLLGISTSYVNLLENNERSVSVSVLLKLLEVYRVDWRDITEDDQATQLADLRAALQDPLFEQDRPDLQQLRAALAHSPDLAACFLRLHGAYQSVSEHFLTLAEAGAAPDMVNLSPEASVHAFFRRRDNHFEPLEDAARALTAGDMFPPDEIYSWIKRKLRDDLGIAVQLAPTGDLPQTLRRYDAQRRQVLLSEALDHPNRVFQLFHIVCLVQHEGLLDELLAEFGIEDERGQARCRVELANYFAAAALMPYDAFLAEARGSKYDFDHLATRFGVSFEQACHRAATLRRPGATGVPFFFLRVDRAGNVTKRFNSTKFHLAEHGGSCPRLEVHGCFRTPGRIVPQLVEMPDASKFVVFARTVDRPSFTRLAQDNRLAIAIGCPIEHAGEIGYADEMHLPAAHATEIGINCRICPRRHCDQRAQPALTTAGPVDTNLRGATRYES